jgi:hypothetical protein
MHASMLTDLDAAEAHLRRAADKAGLLDMVATVESITLTLDQIEIDRRVMERERASIVA